MVALNPHYRSPPNRQGSTASSAMPISSHLNELLFSSLRGIVPQVAQALGHETVALVKSIDSTFDIHVLAKKSKSSLRVVVLIGELGDASRDVEQFGSTLFRKFSTIAFSRNADAESKREEETGIFMPQIYSLEYMHQPSIFERVDEFLYGSPMRSQIGAFFGLNYLRGFIGQQAENSRSETMINNLLKMEVDGACDTPVLVYTEHYRTKALINGMLARGMGWQVIELDMLR